MCDKGYAAGAKAKRPYRQSRHSCKVQQNQALDDRVADKATIYAQYPKVCFPDYPPSCTIHPLVNEN